MRIDMILYISIDKTTRPWREMTRFWTHIILRHMMTQIDRNVPNLIQIDMIASNRVAFLVLGRYLGLSMRLYVCINTRHMMTLIDTNVLNLIQIDMIVSNRVAFLVLERYVCAVTYHHFIISNLVANKTTSTNAILSQHGLEGIIYFSKYLPK